MIFFLFEQKSPQREIRKEEKGDEKEEETLFFALCEPPADTSPILYQAEEH